MKFAGLPAVRGRTPAARRRALASLSDAELGLRMAAMASALREGTTARERKRLAALAGLPLGDVVASPFALRMVALSVERGATTVHQELRAPLAGSGRRATDDPLHGLWQNGVLHEGKYQQFGLEDPLAIFHPDHTSKWGPHELLHRGVGFFHRRDASRFELYLGARLNELLPVVTWYGPEQAMRLREGEFDREQAGRTKEADVRRATWLRGERAARAELALAGRLVREGLEHLEREFAAIDREIATGELVRVEHPFLDASSDALAYVAAHADELESAAVDEVLVRFARSGIERFESVRAYRDHVEQVFDRLLFAPIELDEAKVRGEIEARFAWDLARRASRVKRRRGSRHAAWLDAAAAFAASAREGRAVDARALREELRAHLGREADRVLANGDARFDDGVDRQILSVGIESTCPTVARAVDVDALAALLSTSASHLRRATLPDRIAHCLDVEGESALAEAARFDAALACARTRDAFTEELSLPPERWPDRLRGLRFRASRAFALLRTGHDVLDEALPRRDSATLVGRHRGELVVVPVPPAFEPVFRSLERGAWTGTRMLAALAKRLRLPAARAEELLRTLASSGALAVLADVPSSEDDERHEHR